MRLWETETGKELKRYEGHASFVYGVVFLPDGHRAVSTGEDGTVRLWDLETGKQLRRSDGHAGSVYGVAVFPDGKRMATCGDDGTIRLWSIPKAPAKPKDKP